MDQSGVHSLSSKSCSAQLTWPYALLKTLPKPLVKLWLNLTEIKEADRTALLDFPISMSGLFALHRGTEVITLCATSCLEDPACLLPPVAPREHSRLNSDPGQSQWLSSPSYKRAIPSPGELLRFRSDRAPALS